MTLSLYMDANVHAAVTNGVRLRGIDVVKAQEDGQRTMSDPRLLNRSTELGRVFVTQDDDLLAEASRRQRSGVEFAGVVYAHQLGITIGQFITGLELICIAGDAEYMRNRVEYLPFPGQSHS